MNNEELCNYIEKLRYARNLTQKELVDGIVSLRQYKRYRSGESPMPFNIILAFADRLGIDPIGLLSNFDKEKNEETKLLNNLYGHVTKHELTEAKEIIERLNKTKIIDPTNKLYYKHAKLLFDLEMSYITTKEYVTETVHQISQSNLLDKSSLNQIEIVIMSTLLDYEDIYDVKNIIEKLNEIFENYEDNIYGSENDYTFILVCMRLATYSGIHNDYEKVKHYSKIGIDYCSEYNLMYLLDYFHYFLSLVYFEENQLERHKYHLFQLFNCVRLENRESNINHYEKLVKEDFDVEYKTFMTEYLNDID